MASSTSGVKILNCQVVPSTTRVAKSAISCSSSTPIYDIPPDGFPSLRCTTARHGDIPLHNGFINGRGCFGSRCQRRYGQSNNHNKGNHHRKDTFRHCSFLLNWRAITLPSRQSEAIVSRSEHMTIGGHRYRLGYMYILPDYQAKVNENLYTFYVFYKFMHSLRPTSSSSVVRYIYNSI